MNHIEELEMRRRELVERSRMQRAALAAGLAPLAQKAAAVDHAISSVRRYPMIATALAGAVVLLGSRRMFGWIARGITLYTLLKKV
jgi:hypothetical protein